jgi:hypothetical protein
MAKGVLYVIEDALVVVQLHVLVLNFSLHQGIAFCEELPQLGVAGNVYYTSLYEVLGAE